ncbi:MAG: GNAT family N-acetyltransferase [Actinomycetota bacterium]|nr:GNAT family N-acetyltransferase [Actinomycetota bacterium]
MAKLGSIAVWPPTPIRTERLVLRASEPRDRKAIIELHASPEVCVYLGGARSREELEGSVPQVPGQRPGFFVVEVAGAAVGVVTFERREASRPGHLRPGADEVELGYLFLPEAWGHGYAFEACSAALGWLAGVLPDEGVVLCTQAANQRSMRLAEKLGFVEVDRFEEYGAEQWFAWRPALPPPT